MDSTSGLILSADITTTPGSEPDHCGDTCVQLPGYSYEVPRPTAVYQPAGGNPTPSDDPALSFELRDNNDIPPSDSNYLRFVFVDPLTSGGIDPIVTSTYDGTPYAPYSYECNNCGTYRDVISGEAVSVPRDVPEPPSGSLLSVGLLTLGLFWRKLRHSSGTAPRLGSC